MKGKGVKRLNKGELEISGFFDKGVVNGKGYKKWQRTVVKPVPGAFGKSMRQQVNFIYRGTLSNS